MDKKLIQQLKDGEIAVLNDGTFEQIDAVLREAFPKDTVFNEGVPKRYSEESSIYASSNDKWGAYLGESLPRVSVKDFFTEKDKEIIGYRLVRNEMRDAVRAILSDKRWFDSSFDVLSKEGANFSIKTEISNELEKAGVLDLWFEPVYEENKPKLPTINGYEGKIEGGKLKYGCASLPKEWFSSSSNRHIKSMVLSSDVVINEEKMEQIREYLKHN